MTEDEDSEESGKGLKNQAKAEIDAAQIATESTITTPPVSAAQPRKNSPELEARDVLGGRYQIEAPLGQGGSGIVYRAWDRVLGEPIAIKILRLERASEATWIRRLAREVKVARAIRHPNVCRVFELGHADGRWFVTMELADGTLRGETPRGEIPRGEISRGPTAPRPLDERLADARAVCAGLAAIHAVGIVHRDVTPQNVLRMTDGRLVISDFGLAIEMTANTTVHGGTPNYMPPETLLGARSDQRSDVWQLGMILHEILFGDRPSFDQIGERATMRRPLRPEATPVEEELARLCADCLAPNPADRPATAMVVVGRLASAELARPRTTFERATLRARTALRRHRRAIWAALVVLGLGAGGRGVQVALRPRLCRGASDRLAGVWDRQVRLAARGAFARSGRPYGADAFRNAARLLDDYLRRWTGMYTEACEATHVRGDQSPEVLDLRMGCLGDRLNGVRSLTQLFTRAAGDVVDNAVSAAGALGTLETCADPRALRAVQPLPADPAARAAVARVRLRIADAKALHDAGDELTAIADLKAVVAEARAVGYSPALAEALLLLGEIQALSGDADASRLAVREAAWSAEGARADETEAEAIIFLVYTASVRGRFDEADDWAGQATAVLDRLRGHDRLRAWLEMDLSLNWKFQGRYAEALAHEQRALAIKRQAGAGRGEIARSENNEANILLEMGRFGEALSELDRAVADLSQDLGADHPLVATFISNRGESLDGLGRHAEARAAYRRALAVEERAYGPESTVVAYPLAGMGVSYLEDHRPRAAVEPLERAWRIRAAHEPDLALVARTDFALAQALWEAGTDRPRALRLGAAAQRIYAGRPPAEPQAEARAAQIATWLASCAEG